ncbi:MAG: hypothetical protein JXR83_06990 [Deltaproteobacteria bacterium]|nr:hypothetical protein [Deltaproteobacteria bacterium]
MKKWIGAAVVMVGMGIAMPALGGELPLLIVASDFDLLLGKSAPAQRPTETAQTNKDPRPETTRKGSAPGTALPGKAPAPRALNKL